MLKTIRKNQKKLLAVFTAMLMIVFIVDIGVRRMTPRPKDPAEKVVGRFGSTEITAGEVQAAEYILNQLVFQILVPTGATQPEQPQFQSIVEAMGIPIPIVRQWLQNPTTFVLLEREARQMPVYVDQQQLEYWTSRAAVQLPDRVVKLSSLPEAMDQVRSEIAALLMVVGGFNRMADNFKISRPLVQRASIEESQTLTAYLVPLSVSEFLPLAPQPTSEQLRELFDKYAKVPPNTVPTEADPLGIGYLYPPRVKLQYLAVPRALLHDVVKARKDDYAWELAINRYYLEHPGEFPATQPSTQPTTQPELRPLEEVREQVLQRLQAPEIQRLADDIRRKIETTMSADYRAWLSANPSTTMPSTAPVASAAARQDAPSSLGVRYDSFDYLQLLAEAVQKQFGVLPTTVSIGEFLSEEQLSTAAGIGFAAREVFDRAAGFREPSSHPDNQLLHVWQPSRPQNGPDDTMYIYRLTEVSPSHPPADIREVADKVEADWKLTFAWQHALSIARKLVEDASHSTLPQVVTDRKVITTPPLQRSSFEQIEGLDLTDVRARARLITELFKLASDVNAERQHPLRVIELPEQRMVIAAQLASLTTRATTDQADLLAIQIPLMMRQQFARLHVDRWFSYEGVSERLGYLDRESAQRARVSAGP